MGHADAHRHRGYSSGRRTRPAPKSHGSAPTVARGLMITGTATRDTLGRNGPLGGQSAAPFITFTPGTYLSARLGRLPGRRDGVLAEGTRMLPIGSLENLLSAIGDQATRSLLAIAPYGGADHARRNAAQAAAGPARSDTSATPCPPAGQA